MLQARSTEAEPITQFSLQLDAYDVTDKFGNILKMPILPLHPRPLRYGTRSEFIGRDRACTRRQPDDVVVLEIDNWMAAPSAGAVLADMGAKSHPDRTDRR